GPLITLGGIKAQGACDAHLSEVVGSSGRHDRPQESAARALSTYFFFSSRDGQYSLEQSQYAVDVSSPEAVRGNGLFTFGFLKALVSRESKPLIPIPESAKIDTEDVRRYVEAHVFDIHNPQPDQQLEANPRRHRHILAYVRRAFFVPSELP